MDTTSRVLMASLATIAMLTLAATLVARLTGFTTNSIPDSVVVNVVQVGFRDLPEGVVEVYEWETENSLAKIPSGEGAFLRGVVRSLVRQRRGLEGNTAAMFELTRYDDGRVVLADPETGENIDLIAFGPDNIAVFSELVDRSVSGPESNSNSGTVTDLSW
jgi:putative photosynthetic complex assembly protein